MGTDRKEWDCCYSVTETDAWEPENCPFCTPDKSAASGGNAAPIDPTVQGMADCMDMVRQELIEAGVIGPGIAPMFIANAVMARLAAASAPNAALVAAAQQAYIYLEAIRQKTESAAEFGQLSGINDNLRAALASAGIKP